MNRDQDDWNRREHLTPDDDEIAPRARRRGPVASSSLYRNVVITIALLCSGAYLATQYLGQKKPGSPYPPTTNQTRALAPPLQEVRPPSEARAATTQPLADCIKDGNLIDESVVRCRFGRHPQPREGLQAQGMVSDAYMARFKSEQPQTQKSHEQFSENQLIQQWDGRGWYTARWQVLDNQIDSTSVCANYRRGSIEFRECRKGAKIWFKEQCRRGGTESSHQRYCSAASSFNPMS
ncbi:hypothetical protein ACI2KS_18360 [Pseudomonas sp. NPDC087358]|uniref:hypothetical protein n=1 Tax=Pseudomonas sp. NPDC087358 TaxID=3364439 RepID=UPI00384BBEEC